MQPCEREYAIHVPRPHPQGRAAALRPVAAQNVALSVDRPSALRLADIVHRKPMLPTKAVLRLQPLDPVGRANHVARREPLIISWRTPWELPLAVVRMLPSS